VIALPHAGHVRMLFTSSIAVSQSWPREQGAFPEEPQEDARWCVGSGYGESKFVCEQVRAPVVRSRRLADRRPSS
jgi:thioester reductase-like protein